MSIVEYLVENTLKRGKYTNIEQQNLLKDKFANTIHTYLVNNTCSLNSAVKAGLMWSHTPHMIYIYKQT